MRFTKTSLVVVFAWAVLVSSGKGHPAAVEKFLEAEIVTVGMDYATGSPVVLLRERERGRTIPIWIGLAEAHAILQALHGIETPRPMTHDLAVNLLGAVGVQVDEVSIHDMRGGIFYGSLQLRVAGREDPVVVDCRPSDGLALAVRSEARIRVAEKILSGMPAVDFVPPPGTEQVVQVYGLTVVALSEEWRREFDLPEGQEGLLILAVQGQAGERGFRRGDLITGIDDRHPTTPMEFLEEIMDLAEDREPVIHIWRLDGGESQLKLPATVSAEPTISI